MVSQIITFMVKFYYIYGWFLLHLWWVLHGLTVVVQNNCKENEQKSVLQVEI